MRDFGPETFETVSDFISEMNYLRRENSGAWWHWHGNVCGHAVSLKNYNTYLQIFNVNGKRCASGTMDMKITAWKKELQGAIDRANESRQ